MTRGRRQPIDAVDRALLRRLGAAWSALDRPPGDLDARVAFAIDLPEPDVEVAHAVPAVAGARASGPTRTVAFGCRGLDVLLSVTREAGGVRVDGWFAPADRRRVELRTAPAGPGGRRGSYTTDTDGTGRFAFPAVPYGLAQLVVRDLDRPRRAVVTPSLVL